MPKHRPEKKFLVLRSELKELKNKLNEDSPNSSKSSSSDGLKKRSVNLRKPTNKKAGRKPGHKSHTLKFEDKADSIPYYLTEPNGTCGHEYELTQVPHKVLH